MQKYLKFLGFLAAFGAWFILGQTPAQASEVHAFGGGPTYEEPANLPGAQSGVEQTPSAFAPDIDGAVSTVLGTPQPRGVVAGVQTAGVFKLAGNPTVYVLIDGQLRPFSSAAAFFAWGFTFKDIQTITLSQFAAYSVGPILGIPDGSLVKAAGGQTYIVFAGQKNLAAPAGLLAELGLSLKHAVTVPAGDVAALPFGPAVSPNY